LLATWPHYLKFVQYDDDSVRDFTTEVIDRMSRIDQLVMEAVWPQAA
jgi:hypothetical protein